MTNITELTDEVINNKISEIYKKLRILNTLPKKEQYAIDQLYNLLDEYNFEKERRSIKEDNKSNVVLDTEEIPEKKEEEITTKPKKNIVKKPSTFNKVYKNKE